RLVHPRTVDAKDVFDPGVAERAQPRTLTTPDVDDGTRAQEFEHVRHDRARRPHCLRTRVFVEVRAVPTCPTPSAHSVTLPAPDTSPERRHVGARGAGPSLRPTRRRDHRASEVHSRTRPVVESRRAHTRD